MIIRRQTDINKLKILSLPLFYFSLIRVSQLYTTENEF